MPEKFTHLYYHPLVYVVDIERQPLPTDLVMPTENEIFIDPKGEYAYRPLKYRNYRYNEDALISDVPPEVLELFEGIDKNIVEYRGWRWGKSEEVGVGYFYERGRIVPKGGERIMAKVDPYLKRLETMVGKEVPSRRLHPPAMNLHLPTQMPRYPLVFSERESGKVASLELISNLNIRSPEARVLAKVANLHYEGRI